MISTRRLLLIVFAASLVGVVAWAELVLVLKSTTYIAPVVEHPEVIWVLDEGTINFTPTVTNGAANITWTAEDLPTGASINSGTGNISGTLSTLGKNVAKITATNAGGSMTVYATIHVYASETTIDASWLTTNGPAPYELDGTDVKYTLATNVTTDGTAFFATGPGCGLDLAGYTVTYSNAVDSNIAITNGDLETGDDTGWTLVSGVTVAAGQYLDREVAEEDDGYSLEFVVPAGESRTIETSSTVTVTSGEKYAFTAWVNRPNGSNTVTIRLKGTSDGGLVAENKEGTIGERVFTATANTTAAIEIVVDNAGASAGTTYIDLVKLQRVYQYGVIAYGGGSALYSDVTVAGASQADGFTLDGGDGAVTQGSGAYHDCVPIMCNACEEVTFADVTVTAAGTMGTYGDIIHGTNAKNVHCQSVTVNNNARYITHRENARGCGIRFQAGTIPGDVRIMNNTVNGGPCVGILCQPGTNGDMDVAYNNVYPKARYTNGFGILVNGGGSTLSTDNRVHHNTIDGSVTTDHACRGIHLPAVFDTKVYSNTITARDLPLNQEYGGYSIGGTHGLQLEGASTRVEVYDNVLTVQNKGGSGAQPLRVSLDAASTGNRVYGNTFRAESDGTAIPSGANATNPCNGIYMTGTGDDSDDVQIYDNIFQVSERYWMMRNVSGMVFDSNTWGRISGGGSGYADFVEVGSDDNQDMQFLDQAYSSATEESDWEAMSVPRSPGINSQIDDGTPSTGDTIQLAWTVTIRVTNGGAAEVGATVEVYEANTATLVASGTTNSSGVVTVVLDEYRYASGTMGSQLAYDIDVDSVEQQADYTPTAPATLEIAL